MKEIHFKKIQWKKPDLKGKWQKLKNMKPGDIKAHLKKQHERRQQILEKRRNSKFAKKMAPYYKIMNRFSLPLQALWACIINFIIEALSRHSAIAAWQYMTGTPLVFLYNAGMIFVTLLIAYLVRRRVFTRLIISALWLFLGVVNGVMLAKRVTPFNAQDLKTFTEGLSLFTNYFSVAELVMMGIGVPALLIWLVAMWRRAGQYEGKMHRIPMLIIVVAAFFGYSVLTNVAVDKRIISTYFGNIAFAYQDYGLPYCFSASLFNTGISEPNDYNKDTIEKITDNREMTESTSDNGVRPNVLFVQLESFFDPIEYEDLQMSEDPIPNLRKMFENYSSGYFLVELTGGVSMTGCAIVYGCGKMGVISLRGAVFFIYLGILFVIALVDWHIQMIYDRFHIMILILAVLDFMLYPEMGIATRLTGMGIISVPMLVLALAIPGAFGGGDIKLMSVSGLLIGGASMICAMCIGIITGGAYVTLMLVRKRLNKTDQFAFGPFLAFGLATAIFLGDKMAVWYLQFGAV